MEGHKQEKSKTPETVTNWRENKEKAPDRARTHLIEHGLPREIVTASFSDIETLVKELPLLIEELSFDAGREIKNENRYVVDELTAHLKDAEAYLAYLNAPKSRIRE